MELILFTTFIGIAFILVALGLYRLEHTELSLVGFLLLFLLSMVIITGNLEYKTGETEVYVYGDNYTSYHWDYDYSSPPGLSETNLFHKNTTYIYSPYEDSSGFFTTHNFGYLLAVMSIIGMIGSFVSIKPERFLK